MGTFMGWLKDVEAGGGTAYVYPNLEGTLMPERVCLIYFFIFIPYQFVRK